MKTWTLALLGVPLAFALPTIPSSENCNKTSTTPPPVHPTVLPYNSTYRNWNVTTSAYPNTTTKSSQYPQSSSTAFPTNVFPQGSIPTLKPVIPAYHDADSLHCLDPQEPGPGTPLHYAQENKPGSYEDGTFAVVTPKFNMHSVVLDYANAAQDVIMAQGGDLVISFSDLQAFSRSANSWNTLTQIIFVTFTPGCGDYVDGERCYFLADQLTFDQETLSVRAAGSARDVRDLTDTIHVSWGSYNDHDMSSGSYSNNPTGSNAYPSPSYTTSSSRPYPTSSQGFNASVNGTVNLNNSSSNCNAPSDTKYGLPIACNGPRFDSSLDSGLGYKTSKDFSWNDWVEMMTVEDPYAEPFVVSTDSLSSRDLNKRFFKGLWNKIVNAVAPTIKSLTQSIGNKIKDIIHVPSMNTIIKGAVAAEGIIENVLTGQPNDFDIDFAKIVIPPHKDDPNCAADSTNCDLISKDAKSVQTPWDADGILLKSWGIAPSESELIKGQKLQTKPKGQFLNVYCVKCGVQGSAKVSGSITIKGINVIEGHIDVSVSMVG